MKRIYVKPEQEIVELQYCESLLAGSVTSIDTSLDDADKLLIDDTTPIDDSFWGR
jgi:hypothetical protein